MDRASFDFIVIGGGMAGASAAFALSAAGRVALLEQETRPGYHATGRSAALFAAAYGNVQIRALTNAGAAFLQAPPAGFADAPILAPRGALYVAAPAALSRLDTALAEGRRHVADLQRLDHAGLRRIVPVLRETFAAGGIHEPDARAVDVDLLHQGYLKALRRANGRIVTEAEVQCGRHAAGRWSVETTAGIFDAPVVVNAAGAWADLVARRMGVAPIGLQPKRRTAITIRPDGIEFAAWPLVINLEETLYFKPDAGQLMVSPADETAAEPGDAQPEELDVAVCAERFEAATGIAIRRVSHRWAGLRTFAPDKAPVIGFDPVADGFFWAAGQGGSGIKTAPGAALAIAALVGGKPLPDELTARGASEAALSPARFRT